MKCACGCGEMIAQPTTGRPKRYVNSTHAKRGQRQSSSDVVKVVEDVLKPLDLDWAGPCKPILKYPGAKWTLAPWIVSFFPEHEHYIEPFAGSAAVFFTKSPEHHEVLNDLSSYIVNFFTVLRTRGDELAREVMLSPFSESEYNAIERNLSDGDELEQARRFVVRSWQAHGGTIHQVSGWKHNGLHGNVYPAKLWKHIPERLMAAAERLQNAEIRCRPALDVIRYYDDPTCLLYVDPPYHLDTRARKYYSHEMNNQDHIELLQALAQHKGMIILSGYDHPLYNEMLAGWERATKSSLTEHGNIREEVLWMNRPVAKVHQQGSLWNEEAI